MTIEHTYHVQISELLKRLRLIRDMERINLMYFSFYLSIRSCDHVLKADEGSLVALICISGVRKNHAACN